MGATLHCGEWASHCSGFSYCRARVSADAALGLHSCASRSLEDGIRSCGAWVLLALRHVESSHRKIKRMPPALAGRFLITGPPGKSRSVNSCIGKIILETLTSSKGIKSTSNFYLIKFNFKIFYYKSFVR